MEPIRVLHLEDSPADAQLVERDLERGGIRTVTRRVDSEPAFTQALRDFAPQLVLCDHGGGPFDAPTALRVVRSARPATPVIVITGALDEAGMVACLKAGAEDYVLKANLTRLVPAIEAALAVREPLQRLSPRQLEVLRLLTEGVPTRDIARRLKLSVKTIETHRAEVMRRLAIHDVAGLVRYAVRVGLVAAG